MPRKGLALIIVIGILGVLAILAVAFVMMAQLERRASEQRINAARAYLLARSGIEDALARLGLGQDPAYGGENWDADPQGILSTYEAEQQVTHRTAAGTPADIDTCPVRHAMRPSFFVRGLLAGGASPLPPLPLPIPEAPALGALDRTPALIAVEGRDRGYSGRLAGDYAPKGNTYALKAGAEGSEGRGFYINGGDPAAPATEGYNAVLRRMMGTLAKAIDEEIAPIDNLPVGEQDGWNLIDRRPAKGWENFEQVRKLALSGSAGALGNAGAGTVLGLTKLDALRPYLTLHAWTDKKVIAPNVAFSILNSNGTWLNPETGKSESAKAYHSWGEYKLDPYRRETKPGSRAPDFERIHGKLVGRAPVDLSWARGKRPALIALLGGLKGPYLDETYATSIPYGDVLGRLQAAEVTLAWDPTDICHKVAVWIQTSTSELNTWQQWQDFCDALPDSVVMSAQDYALFLASSAASTNPMNNAWVSFYERYVLRLAALPPPTLSLWLKGQAVRDILKANFNPNSNLNKFSPNLSTWKSVDKGDLLVYSTEFSFLPVSYGQQEVFSMGRVVDRRGRLLAFRVLKALLAGPPPVRLTTQKEFVSEDLGALDIAGDETGSRLPGQSGAPFITVSRGSAKTWGHTLPGLGGQGASLQTYPEPVVNDGAWPSVLLSINPADYDGSIQLATVETAKDDFYTTTGTTDLPTPGTPYRKMMMLARYTGHFDLDQSAADPDGTGPQIAPFHITPRQNHPDFQQVTSNCTGWPTQQRDSGSPNLDELRYSLLRAGNSATGDFKLNTLYPDGCYSEQNRVPEYLDKGNADGFHGVMSFWIKSNHLPPVPINNSAPKHYRGHPILKWTNFSPPSNQFFFWGDTPYSSSFVSWYPLVCQFEIGHSTDDISQEHRCGIGRVLIPHRWELLTLRWDFRAPTNDSALMEMLLNSGRGTLPTEPSERGAQELYTDQLGVFTAGNAPTMAFDITADDIFGPHRLPLGGRGHPEGEDVDEYFGSGSDATFDEFALYDFGGAGPGGVPPASQLTRESPEKLAAARYPEGRYYKESVYKGLHVSVGENRAGEWFSAPIRLGDSPLRIRGLAWSQIVPPELRGQAGGLLGTGIGADLLGGSSSGAAIFFELVDVAGTAYAIDMGEDPLAQRLHNSAFTPVNRAVSGAFRLHAIFQPNLADPENTPILDPLTLDDVTVYYEPLSGRRVIAFGEGEE